MGWRGKLKKKAEQKRKEDAGHPDDQTGPQTLDMAIVADAVRFCQVYLKFFPTPYQVKLLLDESKRIYVCWARQSGKSTTLAARMIQRCIQYPGTLRLIVAPGLRQSMIMMDKIQDFLYNMPKAVRREAIGKMQRTTIRFKNGSRIVAQQPQPSQGIQRSGGPVR